MSDSPEQIPLILWSLPQERVEEDCACSDPALTPALLWTDWDDRVEDDCACPDHGLAPTKTASCNSVALWQRPAQLYRAPLPDAHELAFNPIGRAGVVVLNQAARRVLDAFAIPRTQAQAIKSLPNLASHQAQRAIRQLASLDLLTPGCSPPLEPRPSAYTLSAWLHVTDACNLRCAYCYLDKSGEEMSQTTGRAAVEVVFRAAGRHGFRAVKLKYAGGEPLLNFGLVQTLHQHANNLADQMGLALREVLLSNGAALHDAALDWLAESGVRLMISLDGVGTVHDAQRPCANGQGSFDLVQRNIDRALARGVRPYLSFTVTSHNADHLAEVVAFALERDLLFNLNFYRANDLTATRADLQAQDQELIAGVRQAFAVIEARQPQQSLIGALLDRASFGAPHNYACGAARHYLVIDQRGRVARCQMEIERPVSDIRSADPLAAIRAATDGFENLPVEAKGDCRECAWRTWCAGGCPLLARRSTGRSDARSPYCAVYQALFPQALRLEGLRILNWKPPDA